MSTRAEIVGSHNVERNGSSFTAYAIHVQRDGAEWHILRRFREFVKLRDGLVHSCPAVELPQLPAKKLFGNMSRQVVEKRSAGLQSFLSFCITTPEVSSNRELVSFLARDGNEQSINQQVGPAEAMYGGAGPNASRSGAPGAGETPALHTIIERAAQAFLDIGQQQTATPAADSDDRARAYARAAERASVAPHLVQRAIAFKRVIPAQPPALETSPPTPLSTKVGDEEMAVAVKRVQEAFALLETKVECDLSSERLAT